MNTILTFISNLAFWGFIAVKLAGTSFATWSWWWVLMPFVPWIGLVIKRAGL